ncbi:MAG: hypothetical protein KAI81_06650 [Candidatus Marinimicrobia bacterium]|nr:hypothetical protein [Candidatus Neomarinimicrobiota bacterium]
MKKTNKQFDGYSRDKAKWDHKIFRVFGAEPNSDSDFFDSNSKRTSNVFIDDLSEVFDELNYFGWNFNFGFRLDNNSFYLLYKKPFSLKESKD